MAMPGRKPKPPELHVVEGTGRPDRQPQNTPKPAPKRPTRPEWLLPEAKREWSRVVPHLERLGLLTVVDRTALAIYCQSWARYREAEETLTQHGFTMKTDKGNVIQRPEVSISRNMAQQVRSFCSEFGLTPSSRGRIEIPGEDSDEGDLD